MAILIVETNFETPLTDEEHARLGARVDPCLEAHGARWIRTYLAADRRRTLCEFEAPDAEAVRESFRLAEVDFDRVWTAGWLYTRDG
jgi:hypothetical protein